jgi:iron complex transport system substrate-binding protein
MKKLWCPLLLLLVLSSPAWAVRWQRDETGRSVAVPDHVHRVVSLSPSLTNTIFALRAADDLVGITDYTVYPPEAPRQKPSVGSVVNPSLERIVALHPDMVLALPEFNGAETIAGLERLGIPVFLFTTGDISNIYRTVENVGHVMGREREATALVAELRSREAKVRKQSAGKDRPSTLLVLSVDPLITAGKNAFITQMIEAAGARSVTDDVIQDWLQMNVEAILPRKPYYILLMQGGPVTLKDMQQRAGWSSLEAVRQGRVIVVDNRLQIPAPVAFDGLEDLARQIHAVQSSSLRTDNYNSITGCSGSAVKLRHCPATVKDESSAVDNHCAQREGDSRVLSQETGPVTTTRDFRGGVHAAHDHCPFSSAISIPHFGFSLVC